MSDTTQRRAQRGAAPTTSPRGSYPETSAWVGWIVFAGVMMIMVGVFHAIAGLAALFNSEYYLVTESDLVVQLSYDSWGWTHIVLGVLIAATGFGMLFGQTWARVVGVVIVGIAAVVNMAFVPAYPVWSVILITLDVLIIFALVVHGRELSSTTTTTTTGI